MNPEVSRLYVVDALRGFAIVSIMLLHNIEHFDLYYVPDNLPSWMPAIDKDIWDTLFFLFGGKSYAIFALLFGLTFFIQLDNQQKIGKDFRGRFAWRLLLLLGFGLINSAFYQGDILSIYALIGFFLIPVAKLGNRAVLCIALVLLFQPYEWIKLIAAIQNPDMAAAKSLSGLYFKQMVEYITGDSIVNTWIGNLTNGKMAVFIWSWEKGRVFQTLALFMFGMLAGRKLLFVPSVESKRFWRRTLIIAVIVFVFFYFVNASLNDWITSKAVRRPLKTIGTSWTNMAFMVVLVSGFVLLFQSRYFYRALNIFSPLGRMSLSNYIMQSILGSFIYYGFGLGLYQYTGATYCLFIGLALAIFQGCFSSWWLERNKQGPLETLWHKATWLGSRV